jgi:hypothetical protein
MPCRAVPCRAVEFQVNGGAGIVRHGHGIVEVGNRTAGRFDAPVALDEDLEERQATPACSKAPQILAAAPVASTPVAPPPFHDHIALEDPPKDVKRILEAGAIPIGHLLSRVWLRRLFLDAMPVLYERLWGAIGGPLTPRRRARTAS